MTSRRRKPTPPPSTLVVEVRGFHGELRPWHPETPSSGWSPETALGAALEYAAEEVGEASPSFRRLALRAYRDLLAALPPAVKRTEVLERLSGVNRVAYRFATTAPTRSRPVKTTDV